MCPVLSWRTVPRAQVMGLRPAHPQPPSTDQKKLERTTPEAKEGICPSRHRHQHHHHNLRRCFRRGGFRLQVGSGERCEELSNSEGERRAEGWWMMERLPPELCTRIFSRLDHQGLATALQVCRKWKSLASDDALWSRLFTDRWGVGSAQFYAPPLDGSKPWKDVYEVQDRCDRIGVGLKMVREGEDYYVVYQGEIQRRLGSRGEKKSGEEEGGGGQPQGLSEKMLFFLADLETACAHARRTRRRL